MSVSAIAEISEHVRGFGEWGLANPRHAFPAHLGEGRGGPLHELGQVMAAYARERAAAFRHLRGGIVRTARAEIGRAGEGPHIAAELTFLCFEKSEPLSDARRGMKAGNAVGDDASNACRC